MLAMQRPNIPSILCDACQQPLCGDGLVLWKSRGKELSTTLVVHRHCESSGMVTVLMKEHHTMPLSAYLLLVCEVVTV